ncbi:MMPL family transporter [Nocardia farcinica]|uniref:MMPL family transporter n=1 Tax=Nocardia farcinica TaxID=37329 RepID=UPI002454F652|nr:MMPL family transporter [Nocardia farcinica]
MFTRWGELVYRFRFAVIGIVAAALLALGGYGFGLENHLSSSGWDDPTSESAQAARIADEAFGRDHTSDVIVLYTAPEGKTIDDPEFRDKIVDSLNRLPREHPDEIDKVNGAYWQTETGPGVPLTFGSKDKKYTFASIAIVGDNDTDMVRNYRKVKDVFYIPGVDVQVTGLQAVAGTLNDTMASDQKRMELLAIPAVAVLLFFIFGGLVAAGLPLVVGGLTVIGANGIIMALTKFTEVNSFVGGVVSMIGLGLAIDYGLFIVSRFREELAEGYDTPAAVRRSVMTAGRTVVFSATMIVASLGGMLLFPQGFLKSVAYGTIATVTLAALTAITILPAMLGVLGPRVDMLGLKRFRKTKTAEEVENGFWGKTTQWVMRHPLKIAVPICIVLLLLIIPVKNLAFGGINERYLPPDNKTRVALENFYEVFPLKKTDPVQLVMVSEDSAAVGAVWKQASEAPGLVGSFEVPSRSTTQPDVYRTSATLEDSENANPTIDYLRSMDVPDSVQLYVGGQPTIQKDSIDALLERMPLMIALVLFVTTLLMFLTFGSLVLPIKAALMSALGLGSTLGILTWIFVDGHGSGLLNFTPQPIMSPVLVLIIAVIYGLSTDYEVFLLSRMVEARSMGASTTEAVRAGTAHTGRIITAAALILLVVVGAFAFSDLVMMQYIAYGLIAALFIDATILRMLLVPATMKLLGDDCWWAPAWMKRIQERIGLGEPILDDERPGGGEVVDLVKTTPVTDPVTMQMPAMPEEKQRKSPRRVRTIEEIEAEAPTQRIEDLPEARAKAGKTPPRPRTAMPVAPDPTRPRAHPQPGQEGARPGRPGPASPFQAGSAFQAVPSVDQPATGPKQPGHPGKPAGPSGQSSVPGLGRPLPSRPQPGRSAPPEPEPGPSAQPPHPGGPASPQAGGGAPLPGARPAPPRAPGASVGEPTRPQAPPRPARPVGPTVAGGAAVPSGPVQGGRGPHRAPSGPADGPSGFAGTPGRPNGPTAGAPGGPSRVPDEPGMRGGPSVAPGGPADPGTPGTLPAAHGHRPAAEPPPPVPNGPSPAPNGPRHVPNGPDPQGAAATPAGDPVAEHGEAPEDNRTSIENWMAELRSSRRRSTGGDEGRHHSGDGRSVSVNELLRRQDEE